MSDIVPESPVPAQQPPVQPPAPAQQPPAQPPAAKKGFAVTALVLGIVAIVGSWIPFVSIVSIIIAFVVIVFCDNFRRLSIIGNRFPGQRQWWKQ